MANIILDPSAWTDTVSDSPPMWWQALQADNRYWFYPNDPPSNSELTAITAVDISQLPSTLNFTYEIVETGEVAFQFYYAFNGDAETAVDLGSAISSGDIEVAVPDGATSFYWGVRTINDPVDNQMLAGIVAIGASDSAINFNCDCTDEIGESYQTLAQLRRRMLVRLGFAVQADTPPPGMVDLLNDFLQSAQRKLYQRHKELRTERFFTWTMTPGVRLYSLYGNEEECAKKLDPLKLSWVGVEDASGGDNGTWLSLVSGIPPEYYTTVTNWGLPSNYEIRQCIEVFPAPDREYRLRIKGHFGLLPFADDADKSTIDSELLFLFALADAKAHSRKPDASTVRGEAMQMLGDMKAGRHGTKRYVPNTPDIPPVAKPLFMPLNE